MTRYEYEVVHANTATLTEVLDEKSSEGWRYVEHKEHGLTREIIFERERRETFEKTVADFGSLPDDGTAPHLVYGALTAHETTGNLPTGPDDLATGRFESWSDEKIRECFDTLEADGAITLNDDGEVIKTRGLGGFL